MPPPGANLDWACTEVAGWIVMIGKEYPEHWGGAVESGFWDIVNSKPIRKGDDVFFWQAGGQFVGWTKATDDAFPIEESMPLAPWNDREYLLRFPFNIVSEEPTGDITWGQVAAEAGIRGLPSNGQLSIPEDGLEYVRGLFTRDRPDGGSHVPPGDLDTRDKILTSINSRRGQGAFRTKLLKAYTERCAISGSIVVEILEAAHIRPYRGAHTHRVSNGILLRADIHTLFDLFLVTVDPDYVVRVSPDLAGTEYADFEGKSIRLPKRRADQPAPENLAVHHEGCDWLPLVDQ